MNARDIMKAPALTVGETDALGTAQQTMKRAGIRHLPVVSGGRLVGMLSERDLLRARARGDGDEYWWKLPVSTAMQSPAQFAAPDEALTELAARLAAAKIGALPVVDVGRVIGILTVSDVLEAEVRVAMGTA